MRCINSKTMKSQEPGFQFIHATLIIYEFTIITATLIISKICCYHANET